MFTFLEKLKNCSSGWQSASVVAVACLVSLPLVMSATPTAPDSSPPPSVTLNVQWRSGELREDGLGLQPWSDRERERRRAEAQRVAEANAAAMRNAAPPAGGKTGVNWDAIAKCETGGNWGMTGSTFSGGVGFANTTWNGFGGREFAANAGSATREQQIVVAERVYARYGLSGWGCRRYG